MKINKHNWIFLIITALCAAGCAVKDVNQKNGDSNPQWLNQLVADKKIQNEMYVYDHLIKKHPKLRGFLYISGES